MRARHGAMTELDVPGHWPACGRLVSLSFARVPSSRNLKAVVGQFKRPTNWITNAVRGFLKE